MGGASRKGPGRYRPGRGAGKRRGEKPVFRTCCIGQQHHRKGLLVMNELRKKLGFSPQELDAGLFTWMARQCADVLVKALEQIDDWLAEQRDRRRFRMRDMQPRTLQTLFGVDLTFRRRRYLDRQTGKMVYLLDEVLQLPAQKQLSPALTSWALGQAVLSNSYRGAARSLEALYGHRVVSHESIR